MAPAAAFEFVQGNERLDWGVLVSIDLDRLMRDTNVETLQRVVENVAFARVTRDEASMFTPDHVLHLFKLCQVIVQYLIYSQDCLAMMNVRQNERVQELQKRLTGVEAEQKVLSEQNAALHKETKAQRRTLLAYEYNAGRGDYTRRPPSAQQRRRPRLADEDGAQQHICPFCGEAYHKVESLQSHLRKRHPQPAQSPTTTTTTTAAAQTNWNTPPPLPQAPTMQTQLNANAPIANSNALNNAAAAESRLAEEYRKQEAELHSLRQRLEGLERQIQEHTVQEMQQREKLLLTLLQSQQQQHQQQQQPQQQPVKEERTKASHDAPRHNSPTPSSSSLSSPRHKAHAHGPAVMQSPHAQRHTNSPPAPPAVVAAVPPHIAAIPVMPDVAALRATQGPLQPVPTETAVDVALRQQMVELHKEIAALKAAQTTAVKSHEANTHTALPPPPAPPTPAPPALHTTNNNTTSSSATATTTSTQPQRSVSQPPPRSTTATANSNVDMDSLSPQQRANLLKYGPPGPAFVPPSNVGVKVSGPARAMSVPVVPSAHSTTLPPPPPPPQQTLPLRQQEVPHVQAVPVPLNAQAVTPSTAPAAVVVPLPVPSQPTLPSQPHASSASTAPSSRGSTVAPTPNTTGVLPRPEPAILVQVAPPPPPAPAALVVPHIEQPPVQHSQPDVQQAIPIPQIQQPQPPQPITTSVVPSTLPTPVPVPTPTPTAVPQPPPPQPVVPTPSVMPSLPTPAPLHMPVATTSNNTVTPYPAVPVPVPVPVANAAVPTPQVTNNNSASQWTTVKTFKAIHSGSSSSSSSNTRTPAKKSSSSSSSSSLSGYTY